MKTGRASDEYRKAMLTALRSNFRQISNVMQEGVDADGGYLVPVEYDKRLIDVLDEANIMRGLATKITTSGEHKINIATSKSAAAWIEEGGALTFGDAKFDQNYLDAFKLHVAIKVTEKLLYDSAFNLENYIITMFGKALGNAEEDAFYHTFIEKVELYPQYTPEGRILKHIDFKFPVSFDTENDEKWLINENDVETVILLCRATC